MSNTPKLKTYLIKTYGCQMNFSDSERIDTVLQNAGLVPVKDVNKADVIIFNTCSVRQSAEDRILGLGKQIEKLKKLRNKKFRTTDYGLPITVLTGCMTKRSWDKSVKEIAYREKKYLAQLKRKMPWIDIVIQIKEIIRLPELLGLRPSNHLAIQPFSHYLNITPTFKSKITAYIPISTGCNEFCTYCIVPFARGKQIDRPAEDIIEEVKILVKQGYKDVMLLGQSVNSWKNPKNKSPKDFLELLETIDNIKGDFYLTFISSHPNYFTDELIDYFAKSANAGTKVVEKGKKLTIGNHIRPYLNLALQSGSNEVLAKMNRKYTVEKFKKICRKLKRKIPNLNLSTDIIVGFPNEKEKDFEKTVKVMRELEFDMAYINKYSPREFTATFHMKDNIPLKTKKEREKILTKILKETALKNNSKYKGKTTRVLIERLGKKGNFAFGKTFNFKDIKILIKAKDKIAIGEFKMVKVKKASGFHLEGTFVNKS